MKKSFFFLKRTINQSSEFNWQVGGEMRAIKREMKLICILHVGSPASGVRGNMKSAKLDPTTQQQQNQKKSDISLRNKVGVKTNPKRIIHVSFTP